MRTYAVDTRTRVTDFVAGLVLRGHHGELVAYSQWHCEGSAPHVILPEWSVAAELPDAEPVDARTYAVDFTAPGTSSTLSTEQTPRAHFGVFSMEVQEQEHLLELARRHAPDSIGTTGLTSINFHRSLDGAQVVNLGTWTDFDGFSQLLSRSGFRDDDVYWEGVAEFRPHYFDVVAIVRSEPC